MNNSRAVVIPLTTLAVIAGALTLREVGAALQPLVVAVFLATVFKPLVRRMQRRRVPTSVALLTLLALVGGAFALIAVVGYTSGQWLVAAMPRYVARWRHDLFPEITRRVAALPPGPRRYLQHLNLASLVRPEQISELVTGALNSILAMVGELTMTLLFMLFILGGDGRFSAKLVVALPERGPEIVEVLQSVEGRIQRYLVTTTLISAANGVAMTLVLLAFGVDLAPFWGLLAFLLNFIPTVGSITAGLLPIAVAFLQFPSVGRAAGVAVAVAALQALIGSYVAPRVVGARLDLAPLLVLAALLFFGWAWGVWGAILAVPITSTIKIVFESVPTLRPLAVMMGASRPVPAPKPT